MLVDGDDPGLAGKVGRWAARNIFCTRQRRSDMIGQRVGFACPNQYERSILSDICPGGLLSHVYDRALVDDEEALAVL